jgi:hypothetical protein
MIRRLLGLACLAVTMSLVVWTIQDPAQRNEVVLQERDHAYLGDSHALSAEEARKQVLNISLKKR